VASPVADGHARLPSSFDPASTRSFNKNPADHHPVVIASDPFGATFVSAEGDAGADRWAQ
jgi:hypothetical protein